MRFQSYYNTAVYLIKAYDGSMPLVHFLKQYFAAHKKHGSKDRKFIAHLCYVYYRLGHSLKPISIEERLLAAIYLINEEANGWAVLFDTSWSQWDTSLNIRIQFLQNKYPIFAIKDIFPWHADLSKSIELTQYATSFLMQPDLFLRIRPLKAKLVRPKLAQHQIAFQEVSSTCLSLPNASKIDSVLDTDSEVVVQDYSSQRIAEFLRPMNKTAGSTIQVWDCCAASGGKSILATDVLQHIRLTVSDLRMSILQNLKQRFSVAGITDYHSFVADLSKPLEMKQDAFFQLIICDVPCSGSGTWSRTPEQLYFFTEEKIAEYASLQRKIISNTIPHLASGGYFLYITCSVFLKENEEAVSFIQAQYPLLALQQMEVLKGYDRRADSMFAALFKKVE